MHDRRCVQGRAPRARVDEVNAQAGGLVQGMRHLRARAPHRLAASGMFRAMLRNRLAGFLFAALFGLAGGSSATDAQAQDGSAIGPPVDATLEAIRAGQISLRDERGRRVVVLFYEDRPHVEDNDAFKGELYRFIVDNGLTERVVPYGVANLADVGPVPRALVRRMIAPLVDRWGADILLDWDGVMRRDPFRFATAAANTAILDRSGRITWRHVGRIDEPTRRDFYRALRAALR